MDREFEHVMMNIKGKTGSITQAIYASNLLKIKFIQFVARMAYKGYLSIKSRDNLTAFSKLSEGKYTIYNIPVTTEHANDIKRLEELNIKKQNEIDKGKLKEIQKDINVLTERINAESPVGQLKDKGIKHCCVLPKLDGENGTVQIAIMNKDDQIFKNWFGTHIRTQMSGGNKDINDLKNFTEGNYTIFNLPFEGQELKDACHDFDTLKINYSILPDLKVGNDNSQIAVANADRNKFQIWVKMYREQMLKDEKEPGTIYEMNTESYMDTAILDENEYIAKAEPKYQQANKEFEKQETKTVAPCIIKKDDCEEFVRLKRDDNFEMVTINKESLVDNMSFTAASKKMRDNGYFVSRIPGTYGDNEKHLILPAQNVFVADEGKTYVGFIPKNKPTMVAERSGDIKDTSFAKIYKPYESVSRNMAYVKNLQNKAPAIQNKILAKPKL